MESLRALAVVACLGLTSSNARAEAQDEINAETRPDDARGWETPPGTPPEDAALFVPRVILTPPRLVLTAVFFPIQQGLRWMSRRLGGSDSSPPAHRDVGALAALPHLSYVSGFGATVGGAARYENIGGHGEEGALVARLGGIYAQYAQVSLRADRTAGSRLWLETVTRYEIRPQQLFAGIGDGWSPASRFRERRLLTLGRAGITMGEPGRLVKAGATAIVDHARFGPKDDDYSSDPSIEAIYDTRALVGFTRGVSTVEAQANMIVDTRDTPVRTSSGVYVDTFVGGVPRLDQYGYGHLGVDATGYIDLYRKTRVLVLRGAVESVWGNPADIPFPRLPSLGGPDRLRGYRLDRYRDENSVLASVEYRYPIHASVAGVVFADAGHVARDYASLTAVRRWRAGAGAGIRLRTSDALLLALDFAYGAGPELFLTVFPVDSRHPEATR